MPFDLFAEILTFAREVGYDKIGLTGGEVTRYPHLFDVLSVLERLGYSALIETNGNHRNTALIDEILRAHSRISFSVSLDGADPAAHDDLRGRGTWQSAVDTIRYMTSRGVGVMMNAVVTPNNFNTEREVIEHVEFARKLGAWRLVFSRVVDSGRGIEQGKWQIYPQKKLWLRQILDKHNMWDGFVGHLFHYRDTRPSGGAEHMMSCYRLEARELSMSPNGFHTCCFLHGIVAAPLSAYREYIPSNAPLAYNHLRSASMMQSSESHAIYSCAECTIDYRRYVETVQSFKISDVEIRPNDRRFKQDLLEDPHARHTRPFTTPEALQIVVTQRCAAGCSYCQFDTERSGAELDVKWIDKLLVEAQFLGVKHVCYEGAEPLSHGSFEALLETPGRYGQKAVLVTSGDLWFERRALFERHREAVHQIWFGLDGASRETHEAVRRAPGGHARVIEAMRDAAGLGFTVGAQMVVVPENHGEVGAFLDLAVRTGARLAAVQQLYPRGRARRAGVATLTPAEELEVRRAILRATPTIEALARFASPYATEPPPGAWCPHLDARSAYVDYRGRFHPSPVDVDRADDARLPSIQDRSLYECLADIHALSAGAAGAAGPHATAAEAHRPAAKRDGQMHLKIIY